MCFAFFRTSALCPCPSTALPGFRGGGDGESCLGGVLVGYCVQVSHPQCRVLILQTLYADIFLFMMILVFTHTLGQSCHGCACFVDAFIDSGIQRLMVGDCRVKVHEFHNHFQCVVPNQNARYVPDVLSHYMFFFLG